MRSGCQWNYLSERYGDDSRIHHWFQKWYASGVFERIWAVLISECEVFGAVNRRWQSADGRLNKARFGGEKIGRNPTDRGNPGTKKSVLVLVESDGGWRYRG
jgi:putative transposase